MPRLLNNLLFVLLVFPFTYQKNTLIKKNSKKDITVTSQSPIVTNQTPNTIEIIQTPTSNEIIQTPSSIDTVVQTPTLIDSVSQAPNIEAVIQTPSLSQVMQIPGETVINSSTLDILTPPQLTQDQILPLTSEWSQSSIMGQDVGVGAEGDIYVVGIDGKLYIYNFASNSYSRVVADPDLDGIIRVDVDDEGTPFIVTSCGASYYLSCDNKWIQLPGCATDIGAGFCGHVWKTGCDPRMEGFGIWKLFCKGKDTKCHRFRPLSYSCDKREIDKRDCYWYRVSGSGIRIDVFPDGKPAVIKGNGQAIKYNGEEWKLITGFRGKDISISNDGMAVMAGAETGMYFIHPQKEEENNDEFFDSRYGFTVLDPENIYISDDDQKILDEKTKFIDVGCTMSVSAGPFSQPVCIPCASQYNPVIIMTQKFNYN